MKKIIFLIVFTIGGWQHALAQVATNGGSGLAATYTSLSAAITALNAATITSPVVITLTGNETAPAGGYNITATGTSTNTITIAGSSSTITAPSQTAGSLTDAIFKIVGGDYITIQGFTMQERSLTPVAADVTAGTNTMTEFGVALFYATTTNGAQNCTIQNNTITLSRTYQNTFGIYSNSTHSATNITAAATASSPAGSNSGLKVYGNTISNINHGILIVGPTAAANFNTGIDIGGTASGTGNTISNFGTTGTFSGFLNVSGTVNGIVVRNSTGFNVSYNSITSSNGGISTAGTTLRGIFIPSASISPSGTFTNTINNNTIALTHGFTSGIIQGITVEATTGTATSTQNINNNNFTALRSAALATSGTITAISNVMPNLANNCNGNTFTNISTNTTGSFTFFAHVYNMPATGSQTLDGNSIVTGFSKTGAGGTVTISTSGSSSPNGTFHTFTNNNFSNITVTSATGITGVTNGDGSSSSATRTVTGNTFNNWTGSSAIIGLSYAYIGGTTSSVSNNTLTNITGQGSLTGISIGSLASLATTLNVANNTISNLTGGSVTGLACTNASTTVNINGNTINTLSATAVASTTTALSIGGGATTNVFQNKIYNISGTHASSTVRGILISAGLNINIYNNLIGDLTAPAASGTDVIRGIIIASTTALSTHKIYSNTICLNAASSGTNFGGSGIYHTVNATSTTSALDLQNNIIINGLTPKGTGLAVAFRRSAGAANNLANYATTSDKNLFYAGTPGASNLIYSDGTSSAQTMADYKAGVFTAGTIAPRDANSFTEAWTSSNFESVTGSSANYLQPATTFITQAESGGNTIALTSPDYNNVVRPGLGGTSYDIGAWEFSGQGQTQGLTVTYDSQNGSAIANGSTTTGGSIAASPGTPTRAGFTFNGWFAASSGGSAISFPYTHGQTANFTLYAQWTATYMITVTAGAGGTISPGTGVVNAGSNNTYTITPDAGYLISGVTVDGTSAKPLTTGSYALGGTYDFIDVQGDHTISVTFALVCSSTWTGAISTAWNTAGNWSCGVVPDAASDVTIAATTNQPIISSDVAIKTVTLNTGTSLTVSTGFNLTVTNYIDNSGTLTVENNANLIQTAVANTNSGSGTAIVKRDSNVLKRLDYTMWSSPVTGTQTLLQFSPLTSTTSAVRFYTYNPTTNLYNAATVGNSFATATGYLIRMPNEKPGSLGLTTDYYKGLEAITYNGVFTGAPNNGTISVNSLISDKYYSVGNPYPSTLSADVFLSVNSTAGTLYFWRKTNAAPGTAYSTYTAGLGGVAGASGITPNGTIQVGQGFIVKTAGTSLSFTNAMRETAPNSTQFLKTKKVADKSRLWLDLSDATGRINQVLIGYLDGATVGFDAGIDGKYFNDSKIALTSIIEGEEYVIQGRPTFDATDVVALGFKTDVAGDYSIALNSFDGVFASGQEVYLVDAVAGKEIDIKTGSYSFTATAGVDNARFSLKYQKTLKVDAPSFNENTVSIFKNNGAIVVNSTLKNIKTIEVYDVRGRLIAQQKNVNATTATISHLKVVRQVLIVKVTGEDNKVVSKKIVN
jgi:uncharacterized repeat protein (TIGR02543 family)